MGRREVERTWDHIDVEKKSQVDGAENHVAVCLCFENMSLGLRNSSDL